MALSKILENSITDGVVSSAKLKDFSAAVDLNGVELILDDDQDTSITADTDDRIDFKIANTDHISIGTSSGDTVIKQMTDAKDIKFQQYDGRTLLDINDSGFVGIANGATGAGAIRIFEDTDNGSNYVGLTAGSIGTSLTFTLPTADGSSGQFLKTDGSGALSFDTVSSAADDLTTGDAAVTIATSAGNITIDAQGNDTDIIFKGTDGGADKTFMTIDGSAGGDLFLTGGLIDLKNDGSAVSQIKFYCESSNAHAQTLIGAPHSESATNTLTLPSTGGNSYLLTAASTATVTNKTFTSPKINEDVAVTATATELNLLDGVSGLVQADLTKLAAIDATAAEINLIDGGTSRGTDAVASGDGLLVNDGGTMKMTNVDTVSTYFASHSVGGGNIVTTGALNSGSITSGFGTIDTGSSNITTTGVGAFGSLDISGNIDVDGTTNLDAVDIDGAVQLDATLTVGANDQGYDVILYGDTASANVTWDTSADDLIFNGAAGLIVPDGKLTLASTAVTSTAAELNKLDGAGTLAQAGKQTIWVPATAITPTVTNGCASIATVETTAGRPDMQVLDFDASSDEHAQFSVAFPKSWNAGTVTFQLFWTSTATDTGTCVFELQAVAASDNTTIDVDFGTGQTVSDAAQGAAEELYVSPESNAITIAGSPGDNELVFFDLYRDVSADNMEEDARVIGIKLFFTTDASNDA
jgi:hypothetical protein